MKPLDPYIRRSLVILNRNHTLQQAARALCKNQVGCVLVGDEMGTAVGIVTHQDLICRGGVDPHQQNLLLAQVMSCPLITVEESESIQGVIHLMCEFGLRRIPILRKDLSGHPHFVGIVTLSDLILGNQIQLNEMRQWMERRAVLDHSPLKSSGELNKTVLDHRRQEHHTRSLHRFFGHLQNVSHLEEDRLPSVVEMILSFFCRRVSSACAQHFMAQLPCLLRAKLSVLPAGPDRHFSGKKLIEEISRVYGFSQEEACTVLMRVLQGLVDLLGVDSLIHLSQELPREYRPFFDWVISAGNEPWRRIKAVGSTKGWGVPSSGSQKESE